MDEREWLAEQFESERGRLRAVAYRMLGSTAEAEDAVQETWLRLSRADRGDVENLGGWLTTVVGRVCLDMLRSRGSRREAPMDEPVGPPGAELRVVSGPEEDAVLADSLGAALLLVLETLTPAERLAFVLHDLFAVPFDEIAPIVGRTPAAARQLASRARRRVQGAEAGGGTHVARQREVVTAFLAAAREGEFDALLALLDPDVVLRSDAAATAMGSPAELLGAAAVAGTFSGRARAAQPALIDGVPGLVWASGGETKVVFALTVEDGVITAVEVVAESGRLSAMDVVVLD